MQAAGGGKVAVVDVVFPGGTVAVVVSFGGTLVPVLAVVLVGGVVQGAVLDVPAAVVSVVYWPRAGATKARAITAESTEAKVNVRVREAGVQGVRCACIQNPRV